jgi:hypothetical protein
MSEIGLFIELIFSELIPFFKLLFILHKSNLLRD